MWEAVAASRFMIDIMNKFYQLLFFVLLSVLLMVFVPRPLKTTSGRRSRNLRPTAKRRGGISVLTVTV